MLKINKVDRDYSVWHNGVDIESQWEAVDPIRDMLNVRRKCLLYIKSNNTYVRFMARFLLKNEGLGKYDKIYMTILGDITKFNDISVYFFINNKIKKSLTVCG